MHALMADEHLTLEIDGMHCAACMRRVSLALERAGAHPVSAVTIGRADLHAPAAAAPELIAALAKAGFTARIQG